MCDFMYVGMMTAQS